MCSAEMISVYSGVISQTLVRNEPQPRRYGALARGRNLGRGAVGLARREGAGGGGTGLGVLGPTEHGTPMGGEM